MKGSEHFIRLLSRICTCTTKSKHIVCSLENNVRLHNSKDRCGQQLPDCKYTPDGSGERLNSI